MKKILIIISLFIAVSCVKKEKQSKIYDDRLTNSPIFNEVLNQYFRNKELAKIKNFTLEISNKDDSLELFIRPLIQKRDTLERLPSSYIVYGEKNIFVKLPLCPFLPVDNKSLTVSKYKETVNKIPKYIKVDADRYPVWRILIKNNNYKIKSFFYIPAPDPATFKFIAPKIPEKYYSK